jgi:hypothetical protein
VTTLIWEALIFILKMVSSNGNDSDLEDYITPDEGVFPGRDTVPSGQRDIRSFLKPKSMVDGTAAQQFILGYSQNSESEKDASASTSLKEFIVPDDGTLSQVTDSGKYL